MKAQTDRLRLGMVCLAMIMAQAISPAWVRGDDPNDWPMFNHDPLGTRYNSAEKTLGPGNVAGLGILWTIPTDGLISGTPAVQGNTVYAGDSAGAFYAVNGMTGQVLWKTTLAGASITASAMVLRGTVVFGDKNNGYIYGLNKDDGTVTWKIQPNPVGKPAIWGSGTAVGQNVVIGVASNEETPGNNGPYYSRGSVVLLNPKDGSVIWQTYTISAADYANGASGASVWSSPAYDASTNTIYVSTGNNYDQNTTLTSDAIMALDANTGAVLWTTQEFPHDGWNFTHPQEGLDYDFGDSPQVYNLPNGRKVVSAAQKSGFFHVLDAATGVEIIPPLNPDGLPNTNGVLTQLLPGGKLGGFHTDSAVVGNVVYAPGNNGTGGLGIPQHCEVIAINPDGSIKWQFETTGPSFSGLALANGVVYFQPNSDPYLYALSADTGAVLTKVQTGGSSGGPAISHGRIYVGGGPYFVKGATGFLMGIGLP